ncbi:MAG: hypothetical protein ABIJ08_05330 [Nanoarchaeota archaeon]
MDLSKYKKYILPILLGIALSLGIWSAVKHIRAKEAINAVSQNKQAIEEMKNIMETNVENIKKLKSDIIISEKRLVTINKKLETSELSYSEIKKPASVQETIDTLKSYGYHPYLRGECNEKNK